MNNTGDMITVDAREYFWPLANVRWRVHTTISQAVSDGDGDVCYPEHEVGRVLEQLWQGSLGTQEWRPVEEYHEPHTLEEYAQRIRQEFHWNVEIIADTANNIIILEEDYERSEDEKNDDDCVDDAQANGIAICKKFPELEIADAYCHRHKYAIVHLKLKEK